MVNELLWYKSVLSLMTHTYLLFVDCIIIKHNEIYMHFNYLFNILYVYQADQSPNTNFCSQAKFFICFYTYYEGHFWPKIFLFYCWTWKLVWPTSPLKTPVYTSFKGKIPIQSTSKSSNKSIKIFTKNDPYNMYTNI